MALATKPKRKPPAHYKKRQAGHHKQGRHYLKTYWPYLPMLVIMTTGLWINSVWQHPQVLGSTANYSSMALLNDTNQQRASNHEAALRLDPQLSAAAQAKANDLVQKNYWAHNAPDGRTPWSFITASGYQYQLAGENLAYGFGGSDEVVDAWMNSQEHRTNLLNGQYQDVGFGVAESPNYQGQGPKTVVVAEYAQPVPAVANIRFNVPTNSFNSGTVKGSEQAQELPARKVARLQMLTGIQGTWSVVAVSALSGAALTLFLVRHGYRLHRALNRGEMFVVHHPYLDIAIVLAFTAGYVLTRTAGLIR